mmetsp:Transcript_81665/g.227408  ORF Transcript_81665/g.227408 Transcript_81665/m.227408 type:complete len:219 (+) Transcript_81665:324-980(+)
MVEPATCADLSSPRIRAARLHEFLVGVVAARGRVFRPAFHVFGPAFCGVEVKAPFARVDVQVRRVQLQDVRISQVPQHRVLVGPRVRALKVPEEEAAAPRRVRVAVDVKEQLAARGPIRKHCLHCEHAFVLLWRRVAVAPIQVHAKRIRSCVTQHDTIRVQHGADLENKASPQVCRSRVVREKETQEAVDRELCGRFARMHAARKKTYRAIGKPQRIV